MMKRKLALLLAAVMVISALPVTLFAATSDNRLTKSAMNVPDYTLMYESGLIDTGVSGTVTGNDKIEYWVDGSNLVIELKDPVSEGIVAGNGIFRINLENARFFFRIASSALGTPLSMPADVTTPVQERLHASYPTLVAKSADPTPVYTAQSVATTGDFTSGTGYGDATKTFNEETGAYADGKYIRLYEGTDSKEVPFVMEVSMADSSSATVMLLKNAVAGDRIVIPLVVRTTGTSSDVRVLLTASGTSISSGNYLLASSTSGKTQTRATGTAVSRTDFELDNIVIKEQRLGSIKRGAGFELTAPSGYYFASLADIKVYTESGLSWYGRTGLGQLSKPAGWTAPDGWPVIDADENPVWRNDYAIRYRTRAGREDRGTIEVDMLNITPSTSIPGAIILADVLLIAEDPDVSPTTGRELSLTIRNLGTGTSYTEESFTVAKVSDYIVNMTRRSDVIPELVSGRLDSYMTATSGVYAEVEGISDDHHKAAVVRVEETIPNAWWAERTTEFRLPEGVKILKTKFTNLKNLDSDSTKALTVSPSGSEFYNTGTRENSVVTVRDNELIISRLRVSDTTSTARFDVSLWLNIDVAFEGDIDLSLAGTAVLNETDTPSVTIAKAIRPVEVHTKVTDIKVGYQYVSVADFDIVETRAGNLLHGETVYVSVTDEISVDMNIAKGFNANVTEGNLKISNVMLRSALGYAGEQIDGQLRFDIDRQSTEASTVSFSNVQVKVATNVPYSNISTSAERGINLVVWGSAIARNYEGLISGFRSELGEGGGRLNTRDFFATPGIRARYINVTTAPGGTNEFTNVVKVSIGNPVILIGEDQYTMPVAAYVSTASNSTMVPIRFVSLALGLPETAVKWDPNTSTCTVDAGTRIVQFQTGNTHYLVNGVSVPMLSPDGLPVAMEIRDERGFVPFRALGEAFGINVTWDAVSTTAVYNAPSVL